MSVLSSHQGPYTPGTPTEQCIEPVTLTEMFFNMHAGSIVNGTVKCLQNDLVREASRWEVGMRRKCSEFLQAGFSETKTLWSLAVQHTEVTISLGHLSCFLVTPFGSSWTRDTSTPTECLGSFASALN